MEEQVEAFREESDALQALLAAEPSLDFSAPTQFKDWSAEDILRHLHCFNLAAARSLDGDEAFAGFIARFMEQARDRGQRGAEAASAGDLCGRALLDRWIETAHAMADAFADVDAKRRLKWVGPDMSARSSVTARFMETWSHAQALYDALGVERLNTDRIRNVVVLGVNTFGWTFANRKEEVPSAMPELRLTAPSGDVWQWGEASDDEHISGSAEAFCQVVTQVRNVADTDLEVVGPIANRWMKQAQCFAGPPSDPPAPGVRFRRSV